MSFIRVLFQAVITYVGISYQLEQNSMIDYWGLRGVKAVLWNLAQSFEPFTFAHFILVFGVLLFYAAVSKAWDREGKTTGCVRAGKERRGMGLTVHLPAAFFAVMMVLGWAYSRYNSCRSVLTLQNGQLIKSFFVFLGYDLLFSYLIRWVYLKFSVGFTFSGFLHSETAVTKISRRYNNALMKRPFQTVALTLFILYLPLMIVSYPGLIVSDTVGQTLTGYPELSQTAAAAEPGQTIKPGAHLNNHHPVAHTLLLHGCLVAGEKLLHSWNAGYFLYSLIQELAFICVIAFLLREYIRKYKASASYAGLVLLYVFASPLIHNYVILNTKDVFYALFLLLTVYFWYRLLTEGGKGSVLLLLLSAIGTVIFRNEGQYVLILAALATICLNRKARKRFAAVLLCLMVFSFGYFHLLFPALGIAQGSRREMLSVPFQQTARYIVRYGDQVTAEERETIDAVLDYGQIPKSYDPNLSDPVKDLYREEATTEDLVRYMISWARMGLKHPLTYLSAFVNNKYAYFYPDHELLSLESYKRTGFLFGWITELAEKKGIAPAQPVRLAVFRDLADDMQSWISQFTPLTILMMTSMYPFFFILLLCYSLRKRNRVLISVSLIPIIVLLVCMAGPTNGDHSRYTFPLALMCPFLDPMIRAGRETGSGKHEAMDARAGLFNKTEI